MTKPNCYDCKHRGNVPGDAHSCCNALGEPIIAFAVTTMVGKNPLNVKAREHGVQMGWFNWPLNFDPTWLETCEGFKQK